MFLLPFFVVRLASFAVYVPARHFRPVKSLCGASRRVSCLLRVCECGFAHLFLYLLLKELCATVADAAFCDVEALDDCLIYSHCRCCCYCVYFKCCLTSCRRCCNHPNSDCTLIFAATVIVCVVVVIDTVVLAVVEAFSYL